MNGITSENCPLNSTSFEEESYHADSNQHDVMQNINEVDVNIGTGKNAISDPKENTRTYIAQLYVWAFFVVIGIVFAIGVIKSFSVEDYKDMLVTVSGVLSGPLGFIVGYYFKASQS